MHTRRILLAFSLAASAASVAFADYQNINQSTDSDRLEQLSKTLSQGSYTHPDDLDLPASAKVSVTLREKTVELNNDSLAKKYGTTTAKNSFKTSSSNPYSWLVSHPLPDTVRVSSNFGGRTMGGRAEHHGGLDMAAQVVRQSMRLPGIVTKSGWGTGYTNMLKLTMVMVI